MEPHCSRQTHSGFLLPKNICHHLVDSSASLKTQGLHLFICMLYPLLFHESRSCVLSIFISAPLLHITPCLKPSRCSIMNVWDSEGSVTVRVPRTTGADLGGNPKLPGPLSGPLVVLLTDGESISAYYGGKLAKIATWATVPWPSPGVLPPPSCSGWRESTSPSGPQTWFLLAHKASLCCSLSCPWVYSRGSSARHLLLFIFTLGCRESTSATKCTLHFGSLPSLLPLLPQLLQLGPFPILNPHVKCHECPLRLPDLQPTLPLPLHSAGIPTPFHLRWRDDLLAPAWDRAEEKGPLCPGFVFLEFFLNMEKTY